VIFCTLWRRAGVTIFLTSHILEVVERLADEIAIVAHGQLVHPAAMRDIHARGKASRRSS
jgi:ABC-2 type transport system ATP-binding protein